VTTVIINFVGSVWGSGGQVLRHVPLRWFYTGMIFYGITCLQCAMQVTLTFQALIHFTDWVVGHAHFVMFGVFGFWILGTMTYLFPRLLKTEWYSHALLEWHYWLSAVGMLVMFSVLVLAGIFQGFSWASLAPWEDSITISRPYWFIRLASGLMIIAGQGCFLVNLIQTIRSARRISSTDKTLAAAE
jgi:cytochrome c oxidase cbb3-type subunit 1